MPPSPQPTPAPAEPAGPKFSIDITRANSFFNFANQPGRAVDAATFYLLSGLFADPTNITQLKNLLAIAKVNNGKVSRFSDADRLFSGRTDAVSKFLAPILQHVKTPADFKPPLLACENASALELMEACRILAELTLYNVSQATAKPGDKLDTYKRLIAVCRTAKFVDIAEQAAVNLKKLFPQNSEIADLARDVSIERYNHEQGFDSGPIEQGSFRKNIKNAELQERLEREGRLVQTDDQAAAATNAAEKAYLANPSDPTTVNNYIKILRNRGDLPSLNRAIEVLEPFYEKNKQSSVRRALSGLKIKVCELELEAESQATPNTIVVTERLLTLKRDEWSIRVAEEPDTSVLRVEYGNILLESGIQSESDELFMEALKHFQKAADNNQTGFDAFKGQLEALSNLKWWNEVAALANLALHSRFLKPEDGMNLAYQSLMKLGFENGTPVSDSNRRQLALQLIAQVVVRDVEYSDLATVRQSLLQ